MQHPVALSEIEKRAKAINLRLKSVARAAGLHPSTAYRGAKEGADVRMSTASRLADVVTAEELRLLRHLIGLHPQEAMASLCPERGGQAA